jgi:hypothetical protein
MSINIGIFSDLGDEQLHGAPSSPSLYAIC